MVKLYREAYKIFGCNGILFNHESPRRGEDFVTRKITIAVARIKAEKQDVLELGNMYAKRDWGFAGDYVEGMWMMMQKDKADDYVLSTGETRTVREFVEEAFNCIGEKIVWSGKGLKEVGTNQKGIIRDKVSKQFYRPTEVNFLHGNYEKINKILGWKPTTTFKQLVKKMVENDIIQNEKVL